MPKDTPTSLRLDRTLKKELQHYADEESRPLSHLIEHVLRMWCVWRRQQPNPTYPAARDE